MESDQSFFLCDCGKEIKGRNEKKKSSRLIINKNVDNEMKIKIILDSFLFPGKITKIDRKHIVNRFIKKVFLLFLMGGDYSLSDVTKYNKKLCDKNI